MKSHIEQLVHKICEIMPEGMQNLKEDTKKQVQAVLQAGFERMQLVSREEFDVQCKLLARAKEKLAELEERLNEAKL
jgi:BMFP domain-containing protein YqiC